MSNELIPLSYSGDVEPYGGRFQVPTDWTSCGLAFYVSGAPKVQGVRPVAVALTREWITLCDAEGPIWSLHLTAIKDVRATNLTNVSIPMDSPSGRVYMVPPSAMGVEVSYTLNELGMASRVIWCTLSPSSAHAWVNDIINAGSNPQDLTQVTQKRS